jgi:transcriptional antiterminator RfaH
MNNFKDGWYLIYTRPNHEKKVHASLTEMNIKCYLPLGKKMRTWHDRKKYIDEPLFPSYVFIHLTNLQEYYTGMDTEGSLSYVKTGKVLSRVPESIISNIKLVAEKAENIRVSDCYFRPGQKAVICEGALTGLSCELVEINKKNMYLVRVDILRRNLLISLPTEHVYPADQLWTQTVSKPDKV